MENVRIILSPFLYFNVGSSMDPYSSSFIKFESFLHESEELFSESWSFCKLKMGRSNFWEERILQNVRIIWSPLLYFNLKISMDPNSSLFSSFQWFLHESGVLFSESWNFCKLISGDLISEGNQFWRMSELFGLHFCISILKVLWTQILRYSVVFSHFSMNQGCFS